VSDQITLTAKQLKSALEFVAPDGTEDQLKQEVSIGWISRKESNIGYYAWLTEEPGEGSIFLGID